MATKKATEMVATETATAKRTRKVVKWQEQMDKCTCEMGDILLSNSGNNNIKIVARKFQVALKQICEMIKAGKRGSIQNDIDNVKLAIEVACIKSNICELLEELAGLFAVK